MKISLALVAALMAAPAAAQQRDRLSYTAKIREYTTERYFLTELVDHLPDSTQAPPPDKVLGYVVGAPGRLTYTKDIYRYFRELEKASPRVKTFSMGRSEEGREMLLAVVSDEANMRRLDRLRQITRQLADPRRISPAEARRLIAEGLPMYWATGSIHSPETGSPEMLMELAYRLAVEESPFIETIRRNLVVMITPVVEVDGRDRQVDLYNYREAHPATAPPSLIYWGKYVAHDNNRDGMALSLALSRHMMKTFLEWHPQVLHDLHESVPFLYTSTGMGPYNAWLDPMLINEWQKMAYHEIEEMTRRGVPGVWTHGFYDGWAPNYMFYVANGHNAIGRFYETFGNRGADTMERRVSAAQTSRTWFRPNPPLPRVRWSLRNNINLQQSALLLAMNYTARNKEQFLENFYRKSKRSVEKPFNEGPAAYVIPADDPRPAECADLVNLLRLQGVEVHRLDRDVEIGKQKFPAGSYVVRMDQPYSRMADMLLDTQYYSVSDPRPYDDTGWSLGPLRNVSTHRVTDREILRAPMVMINEDAKAPGGLKGHQQAGGFVMAHNGENILATLRFRLRDVNMLAAEEPFSASGVKFQPGAFLIPAAGNPPNLRERLDREARSLGFYAHAEANLPQVKTHPVAAPRVALVHSWLSTQNEGWYRIAFDRLEIPYDYISDHVLRVTPNLRARWDVIIFGPTPGSAQRVVNGIPMTGEPIPWKRSELTPNIGTSPDQTEDIRGGMGLQGLLHVQRFVQEGGLFVFITTNAAIPIDYGLIEGVAIQQPQQLQARGSVLRAVVADPTSPIVYGYPSRFAVYFNQAPVFAISRPGAPPDAAASRERPSGRGSLNDPDIPQGRPYHPESAAPQPSSGEEPVAEEMQDALRPYLALPRPRVVVRFAEEKDLLVSGMLAGGAALAGKPAVIDVPSGKGHYLLFANNPMWRQQTQGSFFLLFNAMLHYEHLNIGRPAASFRQTPGPSPAVD